MMPSGRSTTKSSSATSLSREEFMQKILNLHRLDRANRIIELKYLLKRSVMMKPTPEEKFVNEYYFHLIKFGGILKEETAKHYTAFYPKLNMTIRIRKRPSSDMDVFNQMFWLKEYESVADSFKKHFDHADTVNILDAGANIGLTSVYFSHLFTKAKLICIEPDDSNFDSLGFNLNANGVSNVEKIKGGIWSKNANLKLVSDFRDKNDWSFRVVETQEKSGLEAFSIPYLMEKYGMKTIDILKIDIEGSEKEIFGAASDTSFLNSVKCIAIEIHDEFNCREMIYEVLKKYNFDFYEDADLTIGINKSLL
jgi:FkbM family methyltransferase